MTQSTNTQPLKTPPSTSLDQPKPRSSKGMVNRDSLLTIFGLSIPVAIYVFAIALPAGRVAKRVRNEIKSTQQIIQGVPLRIAELNALQKTIRRHQVALNRTNSLIPHHAELHSIIQNTARFAKKAHLTVTRLEPRPLVDKASYRIQPFRLHLHGRFEGIAQFLHALETSPRLIIISQCALVRKDGVDGEDIDVGIDFIVYVNSSDNSDFSDNNASSTVQQADTTSGNVPLKG